MPEIFFTCRVHINKFLADDSRATDIIGTDLKPAALSLDPIFTGFRIQIQTVIM